MLTTSMNEDMSPKDETEKPKYVPKAFPSVPWKSHALTRTTPRKSLRFRQTSRSARNRVYNLAIATRGLP